MSGLNEMWVDFLFFQNQVMCKENETSLFIEHEDLLN